MNSVVWIIVSMVHSGYSFGPEFRNEEQCKTAAKHIQQIMATVRNQTYHLPTCIRIEK